MRSLLGGHAVGETGTPEPALSIASWFVSCLRDAAIDATMNELKK